MINYYKNENINLVFVGETDISNIKNKIAKHKDMTSLLTSYTRVTFTNNEQYYISDEDAKQIKEEI